MARARAAFDARRAAARRARGGGDYGRGVHRVAKAAPQLNAAKPPLDCCNSLQPSSDGTPWREVERAVDERKDAERGCVADQPQQDTPAQFGNETRWTGAARVRS